MRELHQKVLVILIGLDNADGKIRFVLAHRQKIMFDQKPFAMAVDVL